MNSEQTPIHEDWRLVYPHAENVKSMRSYGPEIFLVEQRVCVSRLVQLIVYVDTRYSSMITTITRLK